MPRKKVNAATESELVGARVVWYLDGGPRDVDELASLVKRSPSRIQILLEELAERDCFEERGSPLAAKKRSGAAGRRPMWTLAASEAIPLYAKFALKRDRAPRRGSLLFGAAVALHARSKAAGHARSTATELLSVGAAATVVALVQAGIAVVADSGMSAVLLPGPKPAIDGRMSRRLTELREAKGFSLRALAAAATRCLQKTGVEGVIHHGLLARAEEGALLPAPKLEAVMSALEISDAERVLLIRTWWTKKGDGRGAVDRSKVEILEDWASEVADSEVMVKKIPRPRRRADPSA